MERWREIIQEHEKAENERKRKEARRQNIIRMLFFLPNMAYYPIRAVTIWLTKQFATDQSDAVRILPGGYKLNSSLNFPSVNLPR